MCQFLRSFNKGYCSEMWKGTGGALDTDFNDKIKNANLWKMLLVYTIKMDIK